MAITAVTIENFKGIREPVRVELKPVTLLFGPNSAGKSTIIQALHYAREIFERQNLNPDRTLLGGESIDLGGFPRMVFDHDLKHPIRIKIELDLESEDLPDYKDGYEELEHYSSWEADDELGQDAIDYFQIISSRVNSAAVEVTVTWSSLLEKPIISSYVISANNQPLAALRTTDDARHVAITELNFLNRIFFSNEEKKELDLAINSYDDKTEGNDIFEKILSIGLLSRLLLIIDTDKVNPLHLFFKEEVSIGLLSQTSAIPVWGKPLEIDDSIRNVEGVNFKEWGFFVKMLSSLIVGPGELVRDNLRKFCYVGPLREVPARDHKPAFSPDSSRWANGLAAYDTLFFSDETFINSLNEWLTGTDRLDSGYKVEVKKYRELENDHPMILAMLQGRLLDEEMDLRNQLLALPVLRRLLLRDVSRDIELTPQDIGVGISQVLPVVVAALHLKTGIVAIEQPELHIHPAFQVALGDLFIEQIRRRQDLIYILETHSEHLMLRFLRRIRETSEKEAPENRTLEPKELSIYFIEQGETGITCVSIRVDEDGDFIDRWPKGFFNERVRELY